MKQQNNHEDNRQSDSLTDLPVADEQAQEIRGGTQLWGEGKKVNIDFCKTN